MSDILKAVSDKSATLSDIRLTLSDKINFFVRYGSSRAFELGSGIIAMVKIGTTRTVPMVPQDLNASITKNTSPTGRGVLHSYLNSTSIAFLSCRSFFGSRMDSMTFASIAPAVFSLIVPVASISFACWKAFTAMTVSPLK